LIRILEESRMPTVGFIGLGLIGKPMALRIVHAGFPLIVWNRTPGKDNELVDAGARRAASPRELASQVDVLITIVSDPQAVEAVLWGDEGALRGLRAGSILVDSSTVSPSLARREAQECAAMDVESLDAPVTGGTWGAEKGELVFMIGGEEKTVSRAMPVLKAMGKRFFHLGPHGAGQTVKLGMNLLLALEVNALCEALALVQRAGIPGERLVEVMQSSMARAPVLDVKAPLILGRNFAPSFPLRLMLKDVRLAIELARELEVLLPGAEAAERVYTAVKDAAKTDVDYAAIADFWSRG
jgi:3-hydroxyisobutyrate dehydrogenase-like beta-hydroxyacid dehydrogenase